MDGDHCVSSSTSYIIIIKYIHTYIHIYIYNNSNINNTKRNIDGPTLSQNWTSAHITQLK